MNERPTIKISAAVLVIALAAIAIWSHFRSPEARNSGKTFFSDNDGQTWFLDSDQLIPPFDHNGKQAVAAKVYRCGWSKPFVGFLEKYSDAQRALVEQSRQSQLNHDATARTPMVLETSMDVKKPGDPNWVRGGSEPAVYLKVTTVVCPDGSGTPTIVRPSDTDVR
jgi:hypothetical protein